MSNVLRTLSLSLLFGSLSVAANAADLLHANVPAQAQTAKMRIATPGGSVLERVYANAAETASIDPRSLIGASAADGSYRYEISYGQTLDADLAAAAAATRRDGSSTLSDGMPAALESVSGSFSIRNGQLATAGQVEQTAAPGSTGSGAAASPQPKDQVIADDLIVQGSICAGFDCVNNEDFSFDTLRLKENNLRLKFEDTSVGTFPGNDWQLTANDTASGGLDKFSIDDVTGGRTPFTIVAGAPTNALYVASTGRIGVNTATPVLDLHDVTGNTPGLRLEQNGSSGFTPQTWDIAGNEANFFIRDATNGSSLPFRINPGAPSSSIHIIAGGNVGIGTSSPTAKLHVAGDAYVAGTLTQLSSRSSKTNLVAIAADSVLDRLAHLPIWSWNYLRSDTNDRHIGPVAEDFYAAFGFGTSERQLAPSDVAGVALAATQALQREVAARDRTIEALESRLARLERVMLERDAKVDATPIGH